MFCSCVLIGAALWSLPDKNCSSTQDICSFHDRLITMQGTIIAEPDQRIDVARYVVAVDSVEGWGAVSGNMLLSTKKYPEYRYGDALRIQCRLLRPNKTEGAFRYDKYLAKDDIFITCSYPKLVEKIGHKKKVLEYLYFFKDRIAEKIQLLWPEPESSFMAGILYGSRSGLPEKVKNNFSKTGISHIVAVSGYNIAIIAQVMMQVCIAIGLWRRQAFWVVVGILGFFVIFTGASASVVRAGIMGSLVLLAEYIGRPIKVERTLIIAAAVMTMHNPFIILWDIGFQLSFLATAGLVGIGPILKRVLPWTVYLGVFGEALLATLAAQVATLPLILYYFGQLSISAPLVNMLVLWVIPWLMLLGLLAVVLSFVWYPLAWLSALVAEAGLAYVIGLANWFGSLSWSATSFTIPGWAMIGLYAGMVYMYSLYGKNKSI